MNELDYEVDRILPPSEAPRDAMIITMPDGVLPDDYSEPAPEPGVDFYVHFAGEQRRLVSMERQYDTHEIHSVRGHVERVRGACEIVQTFDCGSTRRLRPADANARRLVPQEIEVVTRMPGMGDVRRVHRAVMFERYERQRQSAEAVRARAEAQRQLLGSVAEVVDGAMRGAVDRVLGRMPAGPTACPAPPFSTALHGPLPEIPIAHECESWIVYRVPSSAVAQFLGHGTTWCTAWSKRPPIWGSYARGELYIVQGRGNQKRRRTRYQIHVSGAGEIECARHDNRHLGLLDLRELHPELGAWLAEIHGDAARRRGKATSVFRREYV